MAYGAADLYADIADPGDAMGPGAGDRDWWSQAWDPSGAFSEGGMFGGVPGVEFGGQMYRPGHAGGFGAGLLEAAQGRGDSAAQGVLSQGLESATRRGQAVAQSQRGVNPALAARMGSQQAAAMSLDASRQAAILRAQEQQRARDAYLQLEAQRGQQQMSYNQLMMQKALQEQQSAQQAQGGIISAGGAALGGILSDERCKTDVEPATEQISEFLTNLRPLAFDYADPNQDGARPDRCYGVMVQDAQKSEVGRSMVKRSAGRLEFDPAAAISVLLATVAAQNKRIAALEATQEGGDDA